MYQYSMQQAAAQAIIDLEFKGYQAYAVGGCIRDLLLSRSPKDFDIVTNARPEQVQQVFDRTKAVGAHFGVIIASVLGHSIEIATFRKDGAYTDGRRPDTVEFANTLEEDVQRRDFTINGMAASTANQPFYHRLKDHVGGVQDLDRRLIRAIGEPQERFQQDALRMMRGIRLAAQLKFQIESYTWTAMQDNCALIEKVSQERTRDELLKILRSEDPAGGLSLLYRSGLMHYAFPWINDGFNLGRAMLVFDKLRLHRGFSDGFMFGAFLETVPPRVRAEAVDALKLSSVDQDMALQLGNWQQVVLYADYKSRAQSTLKRYLRKAPFRGQVEFFAIASTLVDATSAMPAINDKLQTRIAVCKSEGIQPRLWLDGHDLLAAGLVGSVIKAALYTIETGQLEGHINSREEAWKYLNIKEQK
jgi:poly(A) polymerase